MCARPRVSVYTEKPPNVWVGASNLNIGNAAVRAAKKPSVGRPGPREEREKVYFEKSRDPDQPLPVQAKRRQERSGWKGYDEHGSRRLWFLTAYFAQWGHERRDDPPEGWSWLGSSVNPGSQQLRGVQREISQWVGRLSRVDRSAFR